MAATQEELLIGAARDGTLDVAQWPLVLEDVLKRLQKIVQSEFSFPPQASTAVPSAPSSDAPSSVTAREDSQLSTVADPLSQQTSSTDKENAAPMMPPPAPPNRESGPRRQVADGVGDALSSFPALAASYQSSISILQDSFADSPPYTVQRLAELVLYPKKHYRYLPPFLNALDRVVSVSSPTTSFPLPQHSVPNGILHTDGAEEQSSSTTGDEGLGGALLTPIPWLRHSHHNEDATTMPDGELHTEHTASIDGPNGAGRIETVSVTVNGIHSSSRANMTNGVDSNGTAAALTTEQELREQGAVTQGELLRQEQEAGVIPVSQVAGRRGQVAGGASAMGPSMDIEMEDAAEETPHARGPEAIGMEDLGPQEGALGAGRALDLEAALGRPRSKSPEAASEAPTIDGVVASEGNGTLVEEEEEEEL